MDPIHRLFVILVSLELLICLVGATFGSFNGVGPIVEISNGKIRGSIERSRLGNNYFQFLGIPYAKKPINNLRFEPPVKIDDWTGIIDATSLKKPCIQFEVMFLGRVQGVEDCLYINVYSPKIPSAEQQSLLPVMVFLHGGAFMSGNPGTYKGKYFMDENIILVTLAYRLASFGFLSTGDGLIRGNMGLKDQNLALQWVRDNIHNFGGDSQRVTLFGESSGGVSVHWHMLSPASQGLFHRAISQSGTATRRNVLNDDFMGQTRYLASKVGCPSFDEAEKIVQCLKTVDAGRIAEAHQEAMEGLRTEFSLYGPIVEAIKDEHTFLGEEPIDILKSGNFRKINWISGINAADGILFATRIQKDEQLSKRLQNPETWSTILPLLLNYDDSFRRYDVASKIREFYFGNGSPTDKDNFQNLTNMFSDRMYFMPCHQAAQIQSFHAPVHLYYFDYKTMRSVYQIAQATERRQRILPAEAQIVKYFVGSWINENLFGAERPYYGSSHADELFLLFNLNVIIEARPGTADYEASRQMVKVWADFAKGKDGDPVTFEGNYWPSVNPNDPSFPYIQISKKISLVSEPFEYRLNFWKSLNLTFFGQQII